MANHQLVIFMLNGESFGIEITKVKEIIMPLDIYKVPNTPNYIEGLINLRGKVHTIFSLRKKLGLPPAAIDNNSKIIVVNVNSMSVGFIVDEVSEIIRIDDTNIESVPETINNFDTKYITNVVKVGDRIILNLDLSSSLSSTEQKEALKILEYTAGKI